MAIRVPSLYPMHRACLTGVIGGQSTLRAATAKLLVAAPATEAQM